MGKRQKTRRASDVSNSKGGSNLQADETKDESNAKVPAALLQSRDAMVEVRTIKGGKDHYITGRAWLQIESGTVEVQGRRLSVGQKQLLTADVQIGGPVTIRIPTEASASASIVLSPILAGKETYHILSKDDARCKQSGATRDWFKVVNSIVGESGCAPDERRVYAVAGSKNLGKSTFARQLVNILLNDHAEVGYLDTDLGQPEFTVPGMISVSILRESDAILGPPYMHRRTPDRSYYIGDTTVEGDPLKVIQAVGELHKWWCHRPDEVFRESEPMTNTMYGKSPLVVNTHGWIQGVGLEVLKGILQITQPTDLIAMASPNPRRNLPDSCFWAPAEFAQNQATRVHIVPGLQNSSAEGNGLANNGGLKMQSAVDLRNLAWLEFAARSVDKPNLVSSSNPSLFSTLATKLAAQSPYECSLANISVEVLHCDVTDDQIPSILNLSVVGLAKRSHESDELAECLGIGVVRGIDAHAGLVYLLTDIAGELLEDVQVLQVGKLRLPQALYETQQLAAPYVSFWSLNQNAFGAGVLKSRNNLKRANQT